MRFNYKAFLCVLLTVLLAPVALAHRTSQGDSEAATFIKAAKFLEENPLDKDAKEIRSKALFWLIQTDKVSVTLCSLLISGLDKKYKYGDVFGQYTLGMAAFKLSNPEKAKDENAV